MYEQYKATGKMPHQDGKGRSPFTKELFESKTFVESIEKNRGVILVTLPIGAVQRANSNLNSTNKYDRDLSWVYAKINAKAYVHELVAHAFKKGLKGYKYTTESEDHRIYHFDINVPLDKQYIPGSQSPNSDEIKRNWPGSKAGQVEQAIDKEAEILQNKQKVPNGK